MANNNTRRARLAGYSGMKRMEAGEAKDYGQRTGRMINSSLLRRDHGKKPFEPGRPQYRLIGDGMTELI